MVKIGEHEVGLVEAIDGAPLDPGRIFAKAVECDNFQDAVAFFENGGQQGPQLGKLLPREYRINTALFKIDIVESVVIKQDEVGLVEATDGAKLDEGRIFGRAVECDDFQDEKLFFENGGQQGPQVAILKPRTYRINRKLFKVTIVKRTDVPDDKVAVINAQDGIPLPQGYVIAPKPEEGVGKNHQYFQDGQAFLDAKGYRGPQEDVLQGGKYYINTWLFKVTQHEFAEVPPGFVAVMRSNLGKELSRDSVAKAKTNADAEDKLVIHDVEEVVLSTDKRTRGIFIEPVATGKYPLNPFAFTPYPVPVSAITIDWAAEREEGRELALSVTGKEKLMVDEVKNKRAEEFFNFNQLRVISQDGFPLDVDVRLIIRIPPEWAAYVIARFGSVKNLIEQIVHPLIDSSFRNEAGKMKAIKFVQSRHELMESALTKAKEEFQKYHIETKALLVAYIDAPEDLLKTQTNKEIAVQEQEQYKEQAKAEEQRIEVKKQEAIAEQQAKLQAAMIGVKTAEYNARAAEVEGRGQGRKSQAILQGLANGIQHVADAVGPDNAAAMQIMDRVRDGNVKVTPDTLVISGDGDGANASILGAFFARTLGEGKNPFEATRRVPEVTEIVTGESGDSEKNKEESKEAVLPRVTENGQVIEGLNKMADSLIPEGMLRAAGIEQANTRATEDGNKKKET